MDIKPGNAWWKGRREEQQDAFGFAGFDDDVLRTHGGVVMVLADGMGGMSGGREASRVAVDHFMAAYRRKAPSEDVATALERALAAANRAVYELALSREGEGEVGTTLVAAVVHQGCAHWIGVGDSRLYLYQAVGDVLSQCTIDQTRGNELLEQVANGTLARSAAEADPDYHALVSFLGLRDIPKVDRSLRPIKLEPGDRLLLVSDGVYGTLTEAEIGMLLRDQAQPAAEAMIQAVENRAGPNQDNATAAVIAFGDTLAATRTAAAPAAEFEQTHRSRTQHPAAVSAKAGPTRRTDHRLWIALAALVLLVSGIIGFFIWTHEPTAPEPSLKSEPTEEPAVLDDPLEPDPARETFHFGDPDPAKEPSEDPSSDSTEGLVGDQEAQPPTDSEAERQPPQPGAEQALPTTPQTPATQPPPQQWQTQPGPVPHYGAPSGAYPGQVNPQPQVQPPAQPPQAPTNPPAPTPKPEQAPAAKDADGAQLPPVEDRRPAKQPDQPAATEQAKEPAKSEKSEAEPEKKRGIFGWLPRWGKSDDQKPAEEDNNTSAFLDTD